jgi:transposase
LKLINRFEEERKMLTMDEITDVRFRYYVMGQKVSEISRELKKDWKTVQKYIDRVDFNKPVPEQSTEIRLCPSLEPHKSTIDKWLEEDRAAPRKQRHTARKVFNRLTKEFSDFGCSYRTVATYYAVKHKEVFSGCKVGFLPLEHRPGEGQVDFGTADFYENGRRVTGKFLEISFPYSNKGYLQLFYGENMECLLEGMDAIFRHIGGVPEELWFDNTKTIVTKVIRGGQRDLTDRFNRFREHYRFQAVFMNPGEGHEKGNVENKVGYHRRNLLVPIPRFLTLSDYNQQLLEMCDKDADREHYRHNETIEALFAEDKQHFHKLPEIKFDLSGSGSIVPNGWGKFYLHKGMHEYSVSPKYANKAVNLKKTSLHLIVLDENYREIVRHRRLYGDTKQQSMDWLPYLRQLSVRPRALKYSGIYDLMPSDMKQFIGGLSNTETGTVLKVLAELTEKTGFDGALNTVTHALSYGTSDAESLKSLHRRLYGEIPELPPMPLGAKMPDIGQMKSSLSDYDTLLMKGGAANA